MEKNNFRYDVHIRLPERLREGEAPTEKSTIFQISGRDTKCEAAKEALLALIPISKPILVPADMHRSLIGKGGEIVSWKNIIKLFGVFRIFLN